MQVYVKYNVFFLIKPRKDETNFTKRKENYKERTYPYPIKKTTKKKDGQTTNNMSKIWTTKVINQTTKIWTGKENRWQRQKFKT